MKAKIIEQFYSNSEALTDEPKSYFSKYPSWFSTSYKKRVKVAKEMIRRQEQKKLEKQLIKDYQDKKLNRGGQNAKLSKEVQKLVAQYHQNTQEWVKERESKPKLIQKFHERRNQK